MTPPTCTTPPATSRLPLGAALAIGANTEVGVVNAQTSGVAGAGATAANGSTVTLSLEGTATGESGPAATTSQRAGAASAVGVAATDLVVSSANATVSVSGSNDSKIAVESQNTVEIGQRGSAEAATGAVGTGAPAAPLADPCVGATAARTTIVGTAPTASAESMSRQSTQHATIASGGSAAADRCAACASPVPATGTESADAMGVDALNTVRTAARVTVDVGGSNFAPITVLIEAVTRILNEGAAAARTLAGLAGGPGSGPVGALGNDVSNEIVLRDSAALRVAGDNRDPIRIVLELVARIFNFGAAEATANGADASAVGLRARNTVDLAGDVHIRVDGSNYAPIEVQLHFITEIENTGTALAVGWRALQPMSAPAEDEPAVASGPATCVGVLGGVGIANTQLAHAPGDGTARNDARYVLGGEGASACVSGPAEATTARTAISGDVIALGIGVTATVASAQIADASTIATSAEAPVAPAAPVLPAAAGTLAAASVAAPAPRPATPAPAAAAGPVALAALAADAPSRPSAPRGQPERGPVRVAGTATAPGGAATIKQLPSTGTSTQPPNSEAPAALALLLTVAGALLAKKGIYR